MWARRESQDQCQTELKRNGGGYPRCYKVKSPARCFPFLAALDLGLEQPIYNTGKFSLYLNWPGIEVYISYSSCPFLPPTPPFAAFHWDLFGDDSLPHLAK